MKLHMQLPCFVQTTIIHGFSKCNLRGTVKHLLHVGRPGEWRPCRPLPSNDTVR